jgi:hypothetical protein
MSCTVSSYEEPTTFEYHLTNQSKFHLTFCKYQEWPDLKKEPFAPHALGFLHQIAFHGHLWRYNFSHAFARSPYLHSRAEIPHVIAKYVYDRLSKLLTYLSVCMSLACVI